MVQLSGDHGVVVEGREDVNQSGSALGRGGGLVMTQSAPLMESSINSNNNKGNAGVTLQLNSDAFLHHSQGNGTPANPFANGDVVKNGFPGRSSAGAPPPPPTVSRSASSSTSVRPPEYAPRPSGRVRRERDAPAGGSDRHRDRRGDPRDRGDRWSYYGDPRARPDQQFLRDPDDRRGAYRDDRHRRDVRDRRDPRDDRRRESDRDRYPPYSDRDRGDRKSSRDPELDGGRDRGRYSPRGRDDRDPEGVVDSIKEERQESEGNEGGSREEVEDREPEIAEEQDREDDHERSRGQDRDPDEDDDRETDRERDQQGHDRDRHREPDDYRRDRDGSYERRRRRDYDREQRDRSYERERERDRDLGRDRGHQPRRREPVGEETGYDSDHSRASRATAVSYSTRSLGRRPRPESVVSLASIGSHVTGRPPPAPRTPKGVRGYEDAYGSRELYDQYQYYYQYYRDHPYYKEYYRQWMKQYGHAYPSHESFYDDRTSIHSGRSSVNDELKKSISSPRAAYDPYGYYYGHASQPPHSSSQFMQDSFGRASVGAYEPSAIYPDGSFSHLKSYASGELSGVPSVGGDSASEAPQRLTPLQHGRPHINARFTQGGGLLFVLPKDPRDGEKAVVQIRDVQKMLCMDPALNKCVHQMKAYPGPLTLADTHKDVVVRYCEQQAAEASRNPSLPDCESVMLIWEYLALLVKQNGKLLGSDIAGLLLKGQDKTSQPQHKRSASTTLTEDMPEASPSEGTPQDEGINLSQATPLSPPRDESALLKKFTEYLCLGRKKEAVDYAMQEALWGHALALSFKMDSTTHTRVLAAFSSSIPRNDVLLTLFQQLSGKRPEVSKSYTPQQWGNWRQHLAMMVSNPTGQSHRDKASIVSLGETLASRGQLHAAHFCYLVAEADWGTFSNKESKLALIGSSHHLAFQAFATNEAIQCTEIYEFARSLDSSNPVLETFQSYKLIYALRLAEYGFPSEALRYCEVICQIVSKTPSSYQGDFLSHVHELASRLKYHDLHYQMCEGEIAEMPDPQWLSNLRTVVDTVKHQEQLAMQEYYEQGYTTATAYQGSGTTPDLYPQTSGTSTTDNHRQGYGVADPAYQQGQGTPDPYQSHASSGDVMDGAYPHQHSSVYPVTSQTPAEGVQTPVIPNEVSQSSDAGSHALESSSPQVPMMMQPQEDQSQFASYGSNYWPGYSPQDPNASQSYMQPDSAEATHSSLPASPEVSRDHRPNSVGSLSQPSSLSSYPAYPQPYQPWDQQQQQSTSNSNNDEPQSRSPDPFEASQRSPEEEAYWAEMAGKKGSNEAKTLKKCGQEGTLKEEQPVQPTKIKNKRVSFKSQASDKTDERTAKDQKNGSIAAEGIHSTNPARSSVSMASKPWHLKQNGRSPSTMQQFPGRVANMELMASLPANHPDRVVSPSRIPRTFPPTMLPNSQKLKVPTNPLIFGGSFPIDDPISPRKLGSSCSGTFRIPLSTPRTYQVDTICCQAPNLCDEHARLGRDTDLAIAEARLQATISEDSEEEASRPSSCLDTSYTSPPLEVGSLPVEDGPHGNSRSCSPCNTKECSCSYVEKPVPYQNVFTYSVNHNIEDGLVPILTDDDDYNYEYQDEEYDEYGGDLYEYEECEEAGARESDCEADYQLRHRHPASLVSTEEPIDVTGIIPTPQQMSSPSPELFKPQEPKEEDENSEIPMFTGFPITAMHPLRLEPSTSSSALSNPLPMFQSLPQQPPHLPSPLPPLLGHNNHVTQKSNDAADTSSKETENSDDDKKKKDKDLDASQDKSGWSIGSLFGWKKSKQAVLPDDKNPSIVWNEEKKRWENKDGGDEVSSPPPPPPKLSAIGPGAPPISLARAGNRKSRYVNTEKDAKQPPNGPSPMMPPPLPGGPPLLGAPPIMPGPHMPPNFMVPAPMAQQQEMENSSPQQSQTGQNPEQQIPTQPQAPQTSAPDSSLMRRSRYISESSIELEEDWPPANIEGTSNDVADGPVPMMAPPGQPQFFNPNQFNPTSPSNPAQTRRVGPGRRLNPGKR